MSEVSRDDRSFIIDKTRGKEMQKFSRILVISRMSQNSQKAVSCGISLASKYKAKLLILHFITHPVEMMAINAPGLLPEEMYTNYKNSLQEAKEQLDIIINKEIHHGLPIKKMISDQDSIEEIVRVVKKEKIDLIVMLAQEEGFLEHALFGGENDAIIRRMPCSILLVKNEPEALEAKE